MLFYYFKCKGKRDRKNTKIAKTKNQGIMVIPNRAVSNSKKSRFIKEQESSELLRSLGI